MKLDWLPLSIVSLVMLSVMSILITILTRKGYSVSFVLMGFGMIFTVAYFLHAFVFSSHNFTITWPIIFLIIVAGLLSTFGNLALFQAANDAPNPGLAIAIGAGLQAPLVAILAFFVFKDKLTAIQIVGILLAVVSIVLINLGSAQEKEKDSVKVTHSAK